MKKFIISVLILFLILFVGTVYLNKVLLPKKIKALIVSTLAQQTGKSVTLKSLEFSFLKGLVLRELVISDNQNVILSTRQATCTIFIWPIFKKQIIIPNINLKAPYIFLERRPDNSFNLQDFFVPHQAAVKKSDFSIAVFKLIISNGNIVFQDDTLPVKLKKEVKNIQLSLQLGLPVKLKFNLSAELASGPLVFINASGEYKILSQELAASLALKNLSTSEFSAYYGNFGDLVSGVIDLQAQINLKNKMLQVNLTSRGDNLIFAKDNFKAKLNSNLQSKIEYNLETKKLEFNGTCDVWQADILGLEFLGQIKDLNGKFVFNQNSLIADNLKAEFLGVRFEIKLGIKDFSTRMLYINTDFDLSILPAIAKDKIDFSLINSASGKAALSLKIQPDHQGVWGVQGSLLLSGAGLKLDKVVSPIENISANLEFSQQGLSWLDTKFKYQGVNYKSSGTLYDFTAPKIKLKLYSDDLSLAADFDLLGKKIKIAQLKGKYLDSQFLVSGEIDQSDPAKPQVDLNGTINLELSNLNKLLEKTCPGIKGSSPLGQLDTQFSLNGSVRDFKNCYLRVKSSSSNFSLYGLKATDLSLDYLQELGIAKLPALQMAFYDGMIEGSGALSLNTTELAYRLELKASGIKLEKLILDTPSKQKNISGIFLGEVKLNGAGSDLNKIDGAGSFVVSQGRLGDLNLLQGLGKLLLTKDLGNIEFTGCTCDFLLKDKFINTDNFKLTSSIVNLAGPIKIGFDRSLEGALDVEILSELVPLGGTFKDVTTAIIGKGGKFGVIKLSGTLSEPKYAFKTAVGNIIQGLANMFLKK
ncbi:MAG: DUF748 domain-containing protein [Candidatus Omnitrophica bacterium]|nr:DUF748 domain-containing protein [Candidatus Omnitrophota bacterium]